MIVCAFGALIKEPLLSEHELLNVHPSLLPRWRGAAPIERAIMAGDERTGVSIMRLTAGLDSGPVCLTASEPIALKDTYGSLARVCSGSVESCWCVPRPIADRGEPLPFAEQDEAGATYAEKIGPGPPAGSHAARRPSSSASCGRCTPISARASRSPDGTLLGVRRAVLAPKQTRRRAKRLCSSDGRAAAVRRPSRRR